jgi:medium-chain acyl-[acyl-carrier-protein] hydrolase
MTLSSWLPYCRHMSNASIRLFCFAYAGGSASVFSGWQELIGPEIQVCAVQAPGRGKRLAEKQFARVDDLAKAASGALLPFLSSHFAFFGHSLGAIVAYEVAQCLGVRGGPLPDRLFVSARRAPHIPTPHGQTWDLPDGQFKVRLVELNGTPPEAFENQELLDLMLPLIRADFRLDELYEPSATQKPLAFPISAYCGLQDDETPIDQMTAWRSTTTSDFDLKCFEAGHFFIDSHKRELISAVRHRLLGHAAYS